MSTVSNSSTSLSSSSENATQEGLDLPCLRISGTNSSRSSSSTVSSLMELGWTEDEQFTIERVKRTKRQLEDEIELIVSQLTLIGQETDCVAECDQIVQDHDETTTKRNMRAGRKKFNRSPKEGIKFLVEKGLLNYTAEDIAMFLYVGELLDKAAIGDYLGEGKEFNIIVLQHYVGLHDLMGMNLVEALRFFLSRFRLPGEAQKIDRMMETFAHRFCACNPGVFGNPDACYILSFSVIMLNTSLHNPNVKDKPTVEKFISINRGINDGKDFPADMLRRLYESIKTEPFQVHEGADDLTHVFFNPDHEGYLIKEGGKHKSWCKRWFILSDNCLYYFKSPNDKEPRGIIPLENLEVKDCVESRRQHVFEICSVQTVQFIHKGTIKACKTTGDGKLVTGNHHVYRIQAQTKDEKDEWMRRINASIASNPFLEMLQQRRQRISNKGPVML